MVKVSDFSVGLEMWLLGEILKPKICACTQVVTGMPAIGVLGLFYLFL